MSRFKNTLNLDKPVRDKYYNIRIGFRTKINDKLLTLKS